MSRRDDGPHKPVVNTVKSASRLRRRNASPASAAASDTEKPADIAGNNPAAEFGPLGGPAGRSEPPRRGKCDRQRDNRKQCGRRFGFPFRGANAPSCKLSL